ncbi:MAG: response regulator [Candidatus Sericytochromatia bacterium]|nr:response regulator [Candidatus Tanganyikabacteria bacterium]
MAKIVARDTEHLLLLAAPLSFLRRNLAFLLQREGLDLIIASDGREALHLVQKHRPTLVILDVDLPGVSGFGVCQCIKEDRSLGALPVLLFSQDPTEDFQEKAWAAGAYDVLRVPFEARDIIEKVSHALVGLPCPEQAAVVEPANGAEGFRTTVVQVLEGRRAVLAPPPRADELLDAYPRNTKAILTFVDGSYTETQWQGSIRKFGEAGVEVYLERLIKREQRRQALRKAVALQARYRLPGDFFRLAQIVNLSIGGMRLTHMRGHLAVGMISEFAINLRGRTVHMRGEIRWLKEFGNDGFDVGVAFVGMEDATRDILLDHLFSSQNQQEEAYEPDVAAGPTIWVRLGELAREVSANTSDDAGAVASFLQQFQNTGHLIDGLSALLEEERYELDDASGGPVRDLVEQIVWEIDHLQARSAKLRNFFRAALRA